MKLSYFLAFLGLAGAAVATPASDNGQWFTIYIRFSCWLACIENLSIDVPGIVEGGIYYDDPGLDVVGDLPGIEVDVWCVGVEEINQWRTGARSFIITLEDL